jgi:sirohydrochlorin ferrochelatase
VLFDNGSLRPEAVLQLRLTALQLQAAIGVRVHPVSLLHSSAIAPERLGGVPAEILEPALVALLQARVTDLVLVPLFFGPSRALTEYVPRRLEHLRCQFPGRRVRLGHWLVDTGKTGDTRIAAILADNARLTIRSQHLTRPPVVLVDHGSPQREVIAVRDILGQQVAHFLDKEIDRLAVASMECRPGTEYDFCEPPLATLLHRPGFAQGHVVVVQQFLSPGRHAGPAGDLVNICNAAERAQPGLKTYLTNPIGADPRLIEVLADRYQEARAGASIW